LKGWKKDRKEGGGEGQKIKNKEKGGIQVPASKNRAEAILLTKKESKEDSAEYQGKEPKRKTLVPPKKGGCPSKKHRGPGEA